MPPLPAHLRIFFSFGAIQAMQLALPLLALPWLGRILGPHAFGLLMYMCVIPPIVHLFMDWGFGLYGARGAAKAREDEQSLKNLVAAVFSAKIILAACCLLAGCLALPLLPHALDHALAYFMAICLGLCRGMNPVWLYQGLGQGMKRMASLDVGASLAALLLIFLFIRKPEDWSRYLLFTAACKGCAYLWLNWEIWRAYAPAPGLRKGLSALAGARALFAGSFFSMAYTYGAQLLLGYFLTASQIGIIVVVNKMLRAMTALVNPFTQTLFPEICRQHAMAPGRTRFLLRCSLAAMTLLMLACAGIIWILAPRAIRFALGPDYGAGVDVLRLMILAAPPMACDYVLGTQALVPFGQEKAQAAVQGCVALLAMFLAAALPLCAGIYGAALLPPLVEICLVAGYLLAIRRHCPAALWAG